MTLLSGGAIAVAALLVAYDTAAPYPFARHMVAHMALVTVAALLLAVGLIGSRWDPVARYPFWFSAIAASMVELAVVWLWHTPRLHLWARNSDAVFVVEQFSFLAAGLY